MRETGAGGWLGMATAGSSSQLSSWTVKVAICDELARWPRQVRSGEGAFPRPFRIGVRSVRWLESEIAEWQRTRPRVLQDRARPDAHALKATTLPRGVPAT